MATSAPSLPPWQEAAQELPPWEAAKQTVTSPTASAGAGGSWTPSVAQRIEQSQFGHNHPLLAEIAGAAVNAGEGVLKGAGQTIRTLGTPSENLSSPFTVATPAGKHYTVNGVAPSLPARLIGNADLSPNGTAQNVGYGAEKFAEFAAPGGVEEKAAGRIGEALADAPRIVRGAAKLIPSAAASGAITGLQGGNPYVGAAIGGAAEGAGQAIKAAAPGLAESAAGITPKMRKFGRRPGRIILDYTRGIRPGTVARTAEDAIQDADATRTAMAQAAERAPVVVQDRVPQRLALPPAPPDRIPVPLHEANAVVERPSILQPAATNNGFPDYAPGAPGFTTRTAAEALPAARSWMTPAETQAADFLDRLAEEGDNGITHVGGSMPNGRITHPLKDPLRTIRQEESAQGVWLRTPEGEVVHVAGAPVRPEDLGFRLTHPNTISRVPAENAAGTFADTLENRFHEAPGAARGIHAQVQRFPEHMTPSEAVDLSRAMGRHIDFGKMPGVGHPDSAQAAIAARFANERQLEGLLGPEFGELGNREGALIAIKNAMLRRELGPGIGQRLMERGAARTGALASAILGGEAAGPVGAITAPILQELSTMPAIRMAAARGADAFPSVVRNVGAPAALTFASNATRK